VSRKGADKIAEQIKYFRLYTLSFTRSLQGKEQPGRPKKELTFLKNNMATQICDLNAGD
jgi:hypothetical protein